MRNFLYNHLVAFVQALLFGGLLFIGYTLLNLLVDEGYIGAQLALYLKIMLASHLIFLTIVEEGNKHKERLNKALKEEAYFERDIEKSIGKRRDNF